MSILKRISTVGMVLGAMVSAVLLQLPAASAADDPDLIPRDLLFGNPERFRGRISPDGSRISFVAPVDGVMNVWVGPAGDLDAAEPVTEDTSRGVRVYFWSANDDVLLYSRDIGGDENTHIYAVDLGSGDVRDLTPFAGARGVVYQVSWSRPDEIAVGINARNPQYFDVYRANIRTGQLQFVYQNDGYESFIIDDDLQIRAGLKRTPDGGGEIHRADLDETGKIGFTAIATIPPEDARNTAMVAMMPDGQRVYLLDSRDRDTAALAALDLDDGGVEILAEDARADVAGVLLDPTTNTLLGYNVNYQRSRWYGVGEDNDRTFGKLAGQISGDANILGMTRDANQWVMVTEAPDDPLPYYLFDRRTGQAKRLFSSYPALAGKPLQPMWPQVIGTRDGLSMVSYLTLPASADRDGDGRADAPVPMVLLVHGGPWARDTYGYSANHQWLANRGYAVLSVNYRGSTGFGKKFLDASRRQWAAAMHEDLIDAVEWAVAEGVTRPDQVAIMGGSYGGYATLVGLTFTPERFACGVDIVGPSNLVTLLNSIPPYWASVLDEFARNIGDPRTEEGREFLMSRSPISRVDAIQRPLLIAQGANDPRVKQAESDQIVEAMQKKGLPVTYVLFPDEGHGFARAENSLAFYGITEAFISACLGGDYEPLGDALEGSSTTVPAGAEHVPGLEAALEGFTPEIRK